MHKISIAKDFSPFPLGKKEVDGPFNAEKFLNTLLYPKLRAAIDDNDKLEVDLGNAFGLNLAFLEAAFTGLISEKKMDYESIDKHLRIITTTPAFDIYIEYIQDYLKEAGQKKQSA